MIEPVPAPAEAPARPVSDGELWPALLSSAASNRRLRVLLQDCRLSGVDGSRVRVVVKSELLPAARGCVGDIESLLATIRGSATTVELESESPADGAGAASPTAAPVTPATEHPLVKRAMELFGGRVVQVYPRQG